MELVALLLASSTNSGEERSDGSDVPTGFPRLRDSCPLPDFVIVNFPKYTGKAFFCKAPEDMDSNILL